MKIRFIGDVHGKFKRYRKIIRDVDTSIQVGDMGVGFYKRIGDELIKTSNPPFDAMAQGDHKFIRGNHDNPTECRNHPFCIPDGTFHNGVFCVGGATSIDKAYRTEGLNWWADEQLSYTEWEKVIETYDRDRPEIVVTHECPESVSFMVCAAFNKSKFAESSMTRQALQTMFEIHKPKVWLFGHWHHDLDIEIEGTRFILLNELSYIDLEV